MIEFVFYIIAALLLLSGLLVISSKNPIHAVLYLIFAFFNAAGIFIIIGAEYIAMTLIIVYVGAVAVLFLFSIMMIDQRQSQKTKKIAILPISLILCAIIFLQLYWSISQSLEYLPDPLAFESEDNTRLIGMLLYTDYFLHLQLVGLLLLVAIIGAILLTLRKAPSNGKGQNIFNQISRTKKDSLIITNPEFKKGIEL
jgi:NADH-quinone oxidoreductase subunit J